MSCITTSKEALESIIPVHPPTVNINRNPTPHKPVGKNLNLLPESVASHLNTLIPVGTAIIIVAEVK